MHYLLQPLTTDYFNFTGRATRKQFWLYMLFLSIIMTVIAAVTIDWAAWTTALTSEEPSFGEIAGPIMPFLICSALLLIPNLAITIRRYRDAGFSPWIYVLLLVTSFIPFIGLLPALASFVILFFPTKQVSSINS